MASPWTPVCAPIRDTGDSTPKGAGMNHDLD
jgi:hypothetical protein